MTTTRLSTTDAFLVVDLEGADLAVGIVRTARKILVDGATLLARSRTYQHALVGQRVAGASAGINATGDATADAVAAFVAEVGGLVEGTRLVLEAGKGTDPAALAPLSAAAPPAFADRAVLRGIGAAAAGAAALGGWEGRTIALEVLDETGAAFVRAAGAEGARLVAVGVAGGTLLAGDGPSGIDLEALVAAGGDGEALAALGRLDPDAPVLAADADVVAPASKPGVVDHEVAAALRARLVLALGPVPVTARGLAVARRQGAEVLPDFLTLAAEGFALVAADDATTEAVRDEAVTAVAETTAEVLGHAEGPYLGACERAEAFLATWQDGLPFGRPIA